MKGMPAASETSLDLLDLKFLPAWVREGEGTEQYADFEGEEGPAFRPPVRERSRERRPPRQARPREDSGRQSPRARDRAARESSRRQYPARPEAHGWNAAAARSSPPPLLEIEVRFLPQPAAFAHVLAQIREGSAAYSVYALARLFLQKPERYDVRVSAKSGLFRLGESGPISADRAALENSAFRHARDQFYRAEVTVHEPVKGNFQSVARERTSGVLLGPTNHHAYQPQLRRLYEQRFSRRLSFPDFQRQIEILTDPAAVEQWKEEARKVTTFTTLHEQPPRVFSSEAEAERHFRETYLASLITETNETIIDGVTSRTLRDRGIARLIENTWADEVRSPSNMMQELAGRLRGGGLHIFRHRRGMLFVSPIRPRAIDEAAVSESVRGILQALKGSLPIDRKHLAEKLITAGESPEATEKAKLGLVADLRWMIREGHVIEFNDGSLSLPRGKATGPVEQRSQVADPAPAISGAEEANEDPSGSGQNVGAIQPDDAEVVAHTPDQEANDDGPSAGEPPASELPPREANYSPTTLSEGSTPS